MALGCHEVWKGADGAADAAWNEAGSPSSSIKIPNSNPSRSSVIRSARQTRSGKAGSSSRGSQTRGGSLSISTPTDESKCVFLEIPPALILEVFTHLDARGLAVLSCVCSLFRRLAADSHGWKDFYCERWGFPAPSSTGDACLSLPGKHWRELYVAREARSKAMMGRFSMDMLHGHTAAVRAVRMLPPANLICTGGYDQTIRLWNLEEGLPVACSRPLGETIRAIAIDTTLLAVGGSDSVVRMWHAIPECPHSFDISGVWNSSPGRGMEIVLHGHMGPVTCLGLDSSNVYSGSWDMTIKSWNRSTLKCSQNFRHMDWVWALARCGRHVLSTAGSDVYTWDAETGQQLRVRMGVHSGQAYAVEGTRSGHIVFTGGADGAVRMFDDRISKRKSSLADPDDDGSLPGIKEAVASWTPHSTPVFSLAFDDPWLVSASGNGSLAMMDVRQIMKRASGIAKHSSGGSGTRWRRSGPYLVSKDGDTAQRRLTGAHQSAYCVDLGADRVVCGGEEKTVRIWDFSQALEIERRVQASRSSQIDHRVRRKQQATSNGVREQKGKHADSVVDEVDVGRKKGEKKLGGSGQSRKPKGQKGTNDFSLPGTSGRSSVRAGPVREYLTRARYLDSVSVPS